MAYKKVKVDGEYITNFEDKARKVWVKVYRYLVTRFIPGVKHIENLSLNTNEDRAKFSIYLTSNEKNWKKIIAYLKKNNIEYMPKSGGEIVITIRK